MRTRALAAKPTVETVSTRGCLPLGVSRPDPFQIERSQFAALLTTDALVIPP